MSLLLLLRNSGAVGAPVDEGPINLRVSRASFGLSVRRGGGGLSVSRSANPNIAVIKEG